MMMKWGAFATSKITIPNSGAYRCVAMLWKDASQLHLLNTRFKYKIELTQTETDNSLQTNTPTLSYGLHSITTQGHQLTEWKNTRLLGGMSVFAEERVGVEDIPLSLLIIGERQSPDAETNTSMPRFGGALPSGDLTSAVCRFVLYISVQRVWISGLEIHSCL